MSGRRNTVNKISSDTGSYTKVVILTDPYTGHYRKMKSQQLLAKLNCLDLNPVAKNTSQTTNITNFFICATIFLNSFK